MTNISTKYLGFELKSPIIASSSDFTSNIESIIELEKAGCGAIVLKSIFEEQILMEIDSLRMNNMFNTYTDNENYIAYYTQKHELDKYLQLISDAKKQVSIPIIASVHCTTGGNWTEYLPKIQQAGADAVELNIFILPSNVLSSAAEIEEQYMTIINNVLQKTSLPLAIKIHHYFTNLANTLVELSKKVDSLVLFNRFFNPDIDIETERVKSGGSFSSPDDNFLIQRWVGILRPHTQKGIAASGGIHNAESMIKNILAGADAIQIATILYRKNISVITEMNQGLKNWMKAKKYDTIADFKGKLSYKNTPNPSLYERAQFMKYFSDFKE